MKIHVSKIICFFMKKESKKFGVMNIYYTFATRNYGIIVLI